VGVAVVDSGIAADHPAVAGRVVARANFVADEPAVVGDPFGHGTHVAGIIGGTAAAAARVTTAYAGGSAPGVHFVDVRVLNREGRGYTSDVIAGIEWAVANRTRYDIDVINLSLGHPVAEPAATDPLVAAVTRAVEAGVVVVVSAGNDGETADGVPILGGITSPGNAPLAITVGALDARGTPDRRDDDVAPFSSRGPTRFDFAVKPDVVAPGTGLVSLESPGSFIVSRFPAAHYAGRGSNAYLRLSGTSMSAGVVSGGVALLLQGNAQLNPAQVKLALQMGATFLPDAGLVGGGAGSVDFSVSQSLVGGVVPRVLTSLTAPLLQGAGGAAHRDTGQLIERLYGGTGIRLVRLEALGWLLSTADDAEGDMLDLLGLRNPLAQVAPNYLVWGSAAGRSDSYYIVWGSGVRSPRGDYIVWGSARQSDYIVWGSMNPDRP
jgi:serine protease AprX